MLGRVRSRIVAESVQNFSGNFAECIYALRRLDFGKILGRVLSRIVAESLPNFCGLHLCLPKARF